MVVETRSVSVAGPKTTGCLDDCGEACVEGEPQQVWHYVGPGQGQYDKVERYTPVQGGSWKIEKVSSGMKMGAAFSWICSLLGIAGIIFAVVIYRGVVVGAVSHDIQVVQDSMYNAPLFNCSRGSWTTSLKAQLDQAAQVYRKSVWKQSDNNFDGILGVEELSASSSKLPSCFAQQTYRWDQDGNGLTQEEVDAGLQVEDVMDAEAEKTFAYADLDCDGALSLSELEHLRSQATFPKYTTDLLGHADVDADNKLSKLEFVAAMRKSGVSASKGSATLGEVWNETKREWCCNYQSIGCGNYVYDIDESHDCSRGAVELWSSVKRQNCCQLTGRGCLERTVGIYDCYAKGPEEWTFKQRDFCCEKVNRGCHRSYKSYNCMEGLSTWKQDWDLHKKLFCCDTEKIGCSTEQFHCDTARSSWSATQKMYCCKAHQLGCEAKEEKKEAPLKAPETIAEKPLYDCRTGWPHDWKAWPLKKQDFCCSNYARGCKDKKGPHAEDFHPATDTVPVLVNAPHLSLPTVTDPFNCQEDKVNWHSWKSSKKAWCCQNKDVACASHGQYDCDAGEEKSWKGEKKDYCCLYQKKGCDF